MGDVEIHSLLFYWENILTTQVVTTRQEIQELYPDRTISDLSDEGVLNLLMTKGYYSSWDNYDVLPSGSFRISKDDEPVSAYMDIRADEIVTEGASMIGQRAASRDQDSERSMKTTVNAFNAMYGTSLTEEQGWAFMIFLKLSRASKGKKTKDDYVDGSAYFGLMGESALRDGVNYG